MLEFYPWGADFSRSFSSRRECGALRRRAGDGTLDAKMLFSHDSTMVRSGTALHRPRGKHPLLKRRDRCRLRTTWRNKMILQPTQQDEARVLPYRVAHRVGQRRTAASCAPVHPRLSISVQEIAAMTRLTRTLGVVLLWSALVACGRVEQPLQNLPQGGSSQGTDGDQGGAAAVGSNSAGSTCVGAANFRCLENCDDRYGREPQCVDGMFRCTRSDWDSSLCPLDTPGSCAGKVAPQCRASCALNNEVMPECVNGDLQCPAASVDRETCPITSCSSGATCCLGNGTATVPSCNAGTLDECPEGNKLTPGSKLTRGQCFPDGVEAKSCEELDGQACESPDLVCSSGCWLSCGCQTDPQGMLVWRCTHNPC